jgi:hypothetical protein
MHRSIAYLGAATLVIAFAFITFPIWAFGAESFDFEQELGILLLPAGLLVLLAAGVSTDPRLTTVGGAFGNPEFEPAVRRAGTGSMPAPRTPYHPREAVQCEHCGSMIAPDLARCLRCTQVRPCRSCGRPLGMVLDRPTCPRCAKPEVFCDCPVMPRASVPGDRLRSRSVRR